MGRVVDFVLASVVSGSLSGAIVSSCVQPLDVLRTKIQADSARGVTRSTAETAALIVREGGGVAALWRGTQPTVVRLALGAGLHFLFLDSLKPLFETRDAAGAPRMTAVGAALTGGLSRGLAALVSCPVTVVKTRMEYVVTGGGGGLPGPPQYRNTIDALRTIAKTEGVRGLYRGLGPTMLSNAPFSALYYMFYTRLQGRLAAAGAAREDGSGGRGVAVPTTAINFVSGTVAAVAATLITQPADVVRTRVQLGLAAAAASGVSGASASMPALLRHIVAQQGARGLLAGAAPRIVKRTLQTALVWTLYEELSPRLQAARAAAAHMWSENQRKHT